MTSAIETAGTVPCGRARAESDPWIPLKVVWESVLDGPRLHAFVRDEQEGYVELRVDPASGSLAELVVIELPRQVHRTVDAVDVREYLAPVIDLDLWPWKVTPDYREPAVTDVDVESALTCTVHDDETSIWFSDDPVLSLLAVGPVRVGLGADGGLVAVIATTSRVAYV